METKVSRAHFFWSCDANLGYQSLKYVTIWWQPNLLRPNVIWPRSPDLTIWHKNQDHQILLHVKKTKVTRTYSMSCDENQDHQTLLHITKTKVTRPYCTWVVTLTKVIGPQCMYWRDGNLRYPNPTSCDAGTAPKINRPYSMYRRSLEIFYLCRFP